jgi:hypothetical protein
MVNLLWAVGLEQITPYLLTYLLTYSTQHSPSWEANRFAASQEIPRILSKTKVHYGIHKCPPPVSTLSQLNPLLIPTSHLPKIHHNIILPPTPESPQRCLSLRFPHQNLYSPLPSPTELHAPSISQIPLNTYISMYVRTSRCYNERGSRNNCVRSSTAQWVLECKM